MEYTISDSIKAFADFTQAEGIKGNLVVKIPKDNLGVLYYSFGQYPEDKRIVEERLDRLNTLIVAHLNTLKLYSDRYLGGRLSVFLLVDFKYIKKGTFDKFASFQNIVKNRSILQKLENIKSEETAQALVKAVYVRYPDVSKMRWGVRVAMTPLRKFRRLSSLITDFKDLNELSFNTEINCSMESFMAFDEGLRDFDSPVLVDSLVEQLDSPL